MLPHYLPCHCDKRLGDDHQVNGKGPVQIQANDDVIEDNTNCIIQRKMHITIIFMLNYIIIMLGDLLRKRDHLGKIHTNTMKLVMMMF